MFEYVKGLSCQAERQRDEAGLNGCLAVKARMWAAAVVEVGVAVSRLRSLDPRIEDLLTTLHKLYASNSIDAEPWR